MPRAFCYWCGAYVPLDADSKFIEHLDQGESQAGRRRCSGTGHVPTTNDQAEANAGRARRRVEGISGLDGQHQNLLVEILIRIETLEKAQGYVPSHSHVETSREELRLFIKRLRGIVLTDEEKAILEEDLSDEGS